MQQPTKVMDTLNGVKRLLSYGMAPEGKGTPLTKTESLNIGREYQLARMRTLVLEKALEDILRAGASVHNCVVLKREEYIALVETKQQKEEVYE